MRHWSIVIGLALVLGATRAGAERHHHGDGDGGGGGGGRGEHHGEHGEDEDDDDDDGGAPAKPITRTPEQSEYREKVLAKEHALVKELAHKHGRRIAMEDRSRIGMHWRHVMRLLRIRELAQEDKDAAVVAKCDDLIDRADRRLREQLEGKDGGAK
jgi:hypothetical protein